MKHVSLRRRLLCGFLPAVLLFTSCAPKAEVESKPPAPDDPPEAVAVVEDSPAFTLDQETFAITFKSNGKEIAVSMPSSPRKVENYTKEESVTHWSYPEEGISVEVEPKKGYLGVTIRSDVKEDNSFQWPVVAGSEYLIPLGEGKRIPGKDAVWVDYLAGEKVNVMEQLSMPFWATIDGDYAVLCIMENPFRSTMDFNNKEPLGFALSHYYPEIDTEKENRFRFYLTKNNPVDIAKTYKNYVVEQGKFVTLAQKEEQNPNIEKLYGAPFIYIFNDRVLVPEDVNWPAFRSALSAGKLKAVEKLLGNTSSGTEILEVLGQLEKQDYIDQYQKNAICLGLSEILQKKDFYTPAAFPIKTDEMDKLIGKGLDQLNDMEWIQLNKQALFDNLPNVFVPVEQWNDDATTGLIEKLKEAGLDRAWLGLNGGWQQAYAKPELVPAAEKAGYLVGPYDSYHSIHKPGEEQWSTAAFPDQELYENATVTNQKGEKIEGFKGVGRKLNPTLSMPAVKQRLDAIISTGTQFNSWFIDCDATGEIFDDYTTTHLTTQQQDLAARLERMTYIKDDKNMVIGSEGGNDFAAPVIAFSHGIELPTFSWMDDDMKNNKDSEYYIGGWYSPTGGVPEHFAKTVPIKDKFYQLFLNPLYDVPLYKLVYNNSVITSYHWDWSTFKINGHVKERMLREVLYNVPPMYHLDDAEWELYNGAITDHTKVWSAFSRKAVQLEMTDFQMLSEDGSLQRTSYGEDLSVVANFGEKPSTYEGEDVPPQSLLIFSEGKVTLYTPDNEF